MFKKIIFTGILLISISVLKADPTTANSFVPGLFSQNANEGLVNKIAADNDFKKYYISNVEFANKIIETNAGSLFLKYIQQKITADETAVLFAKMNVAGKKEFDAIAMNLRNEAVAFYNKFPELKLKTEREQKELLINSFKKISVDNTVATKFVKARNITPEECFWSWMACLGLSAITCSYEQDYSYCMWTMAEVCSTAYGICWFIAE